MAWLAIPLGVLVLLALGLVGYAGSRMGRLPEGHPAEVLADGGPPVDRPVLLCLGDSITQGGLGADWVGALRQRLGDEAFVINAGVGGQVTWDLRQRLDEVARCKPAAVVLMAGSNDAVGTLGGGWASFYARGRPQAPSETWFAAQFDTLVRELNELTPRLVCMTLPPLGEDPSAKTGSIVRRLNEAIRRTASEHGADVLDLHAVFTELNADRTSAGVPFLRGLGQFMALALGSILRRQVLGQSWDAIGQRRGLRLTTDTIHPNDRAARLIVDQVARWAEHSLAETRPEHTT